MCIAKCSSGDVDMRKVSCVLFDNNCSKNSRSANRMWFSLLLVKFHWFGINWRVFNQSECINCWSYIVIQKIKPKANSGKYFQIWFFPQFGRKNGGVLSMRMQVILDSLFTRPGSTPTGGGKKGEFREWTRAGAVTSFWTKEQLRKFLTRTFLGCRC